MRAGFKRIPEVVTKRLLKDFTMRRMDDESAHETKRELTGRPHHLQRPTDGKLSTKKSTRKLEATSSPVYVNLARPGRHHRYCNVLCSNCIKLVQVIALNTFVASD